MNPTLLATSLSIAALLLSGCAGQSTAYEGSLVYNGAAAGSHQATADCDKAGTFHWSANVGSGSVTVRVRDAAGNLVFDETTAGPGQTANSKPVSGPAGTWTMHVERKASSQYGMSMWSGQYAAYLDC